MDYAAPLGTPVESIGDGTVINRGFQAKGGGNFVKIRHNSTYSSTYMHLLRISPSVKIGSRVSQGQVIGYVGSSGLSSGPHLDFRVYKNGVPVNPLKVESPPVEPVKKDKMTEFNKIKDEAVKKLSEF